MFSVGVSFTNAISPPLTTAEGQIQPGLFKDPHSALQTRCLRTRSPPLDKENSIILPVTNVSLFPHRQVCTARTAQIQADIQ